MPVTKIRSKWENGDLVFTDHGGTEIFKLEDGNQAIDITKLRLGGVAVTATAAQLNSVSAAIRVANKTGGDLDKGTLVYISGYDAGLAAPTVTVSSATAEATHVLTETIANNAAGFADEEAIVTGIDTDAAGAVGDPLYLAAAGGFGAAALTGADQISQVVGVVIVKSATVGSALFIPGATRTAAIGTSAIQNKAVTVGKITAAAGTVLIGTTTTDAASALNNSAAGSVVIGQGAALSCAAHTLSGDVTMVAGGAVTIGNNAVTTAKINAKAVTAEKIAAAAGTVLIGTKTSGDVTALNASASGAVVIGQGAGETCAAHAVTGDVSMNNAGVTAIGAKKVVNTMIAAAAGTVLVGTVTSGDVTALDNSTAGAVVIGQGAGATCAAHALSGDITMAAGGATAIGAGKVTNAMLASGAGVAALLTAGLGGSASVAKTETATKTIVAADGVKARACIVVAIVDEEFDTGDASRTMVQVGEEDTLDLLWGAAQFAHTTAAGTVFVGAFTNTATKAITVDVVAAGGTGTGGASITVIAIPTT